MTSESKKGLILYGAFKGCHSFSKSRCFGSNATSFARPTDVLASAGACESVDSKIKENRHKFKRRGKLLQGAKNVKSTCYQINPDLFFPVQRHPSPVRLAFRQFYSPTLNEDGGLKEVVSAVRKYRYMPRCRLFVEMLYHAFDASMTIQRPVRLRPSFPWALFVFGAQEAFEATLMPRRDLSRASLVRGSRLKNRHYSHFIVLEGSDA